MAMVLRVSSPVGLSSAKTSSPVTTFTNLIGSPGSEKGTQAKNIIIPTIIQSGMGAAIQIKKTGRYCINLLARFIEQRLP
ncbi:conserved hypothetical protein [Roseibium sp. TrichSKD4]|nr:conserved hypothetical protein [Roseibium sp. TrichSKD4]